MRLRYLVPLLLLPSLCLAGSNFGRQTTKPLAEFILGEWIYKLRHTTPDFDLSESGMAVYHSDGTGYVEYIAKETYTNKSYVCNLKTRIDFTWSVEADQLAETATKYDVLVLSGNCSDYADSIGNPYAGAGWTWTFKLNERTANRLVLQAIHHLDHEIKTLNRDLTESD